MVDPLNRWMFFDNGPASSIVWFTAVPINFGYYEFTYEAYLEIAPQYSFTGTFSALLANRVEFCTPDVPPVMPLPVDVCISPPTDVNSGITDKPTWMQQISDFNDVSNLADSSVTLGPCVDENGLPLYCNLNLGVIEDFCDSNPTTSTLGGSLTLNCFAQFVDPEDAGWYLLTIYANDTSNPASLSYIHSVAMKVQYYETGGLAIEDEIFEEDF